MQYVTGHFRSSRLFFYFFKHSSKIIPLFGGSIFILQPENPRKYSSKTEKSRLTIFKHVSLFWNISEHSETNFTLKVDPLVTLCHFFWLQEVATNEDIEDFRAEHRVTHTESGYNAKDLKLIWIPDSRHGWLPI